MLLSSRIKLALGVWIVLEIVAFGLVAQAIGVPRTILLGVISSLLGLILLRRAGTSALMKLRASLEARPLASGDQSHFLDEILATVGALALLLPGFVSDLVGLALAFPILRARAARWLGGRGLAAAMGFGAKGAGPAPRHGPTTIDLEPDEWRHTEAGAQRVTKPSP